MEELEFEISRLEDNKKIMVVAAQSFKEAIQKFSESYIMREKDKFAVKHDGNQVVFEFVNSSLKLCS